MRAEKLTRIYDGLRAVDTLIAKAIRVDELAQTARIETKLREYIAVQWEDLSKQASRTVTARLRKGKGPVTDAEITRLNKLVDRTMAQWSGRIADRYTEDMRETYELAHIAANKRALGRRKRSMEFNTRPWDTGEVKKAAPIPAAEIGANFDLVDLQNMDAFEDQQLFWIGQHYDENVSKHVHDTARKHIIEQGRGRVEAGKTMQKVVATALNEVRVPGGFNGTAKKYFEGLVANSATVQRNMAQLNSFTRAGFTRIVVVNPSDHRTCPRCDLMNGREFKISDANKIADRLRNAKDPTDVRKIQPFMSAADAKLSNSALVDRGNVIGPYHFKCFAGETPVLTQQGLKRIDTVQIGDEVLTHRCRWRRVEAVMRRRHHGEFLQIDGITATSDHPFLLRRGKRAIFSVVADGDRVAKLSKSPDEVRELREDLLCAPIEVRDAPLLLEEVHEGESFASSEFETTVARTEGREDMRVLQQSGFDPGLESKELPFLLNGMPPSGIDQRRVCGMPSVWEGILAHAVLETHGSSDVFADLPLGTLEKNWHWSQMWPEKRCVFREKEPNVRSSPDKREGPASVDYNALARQDKSTESLGRKSRERATYSQREVFIRNEAFRTPRTNNLPSRLLFASPQHMDRSQGTNETQRRDYKEAFSGEASLDSPSRDETINFVRPRDVRRFQDCLEVWNLTVEEDESFIVGDEGLVVHNCRCSFDITEEEELIPVL